MIAHIVQRYLPAPLTGSERYIQSISEYFVKRGYYVDVLTSDAHDWGAFYFPFKKRFHKKEDIINGVSIKVSYTL